VPFLCLVNGSKAVVFTKEDHGKEITIFAAAIFEVRLEHSGGTGYLWQIVEPDKTHLRVLDSNEIPLKEGRILGGPLLKTWKIKAVKVGQADLKVLLYRPWEGPAKAVDSLQVKIQIK
jgi:predicted secreted protein